VDTRSAAAWTEIGQDIERLQQAQRGDRDALLQLFAAYQLPLWRTCLAITHHHGDADRLFEHTIACASHELASAPDGQPLLLWLVRLARELDAHRARTSPRDPALAGTQRPDGQPWDERAPDVDIERHALRAFAQLDADDQWLLALRLFERLSYADIARVTGKSLDEVAERLSFVRDEIDHGLDAEERAA